MASKTMKATFMTGINYLNHQQYSTGGNLGGMQMINRRLQFCKNLYSKDLYAHYGCVNAVEFSNDGEWLVSGGDDKRVLIWNVDRTLSGSNQPKVMKGEHNSNIFCLGFNSSHTKLYSAGNDEQVILHDVKTAEILDVFLHDEAVYGLSVDPVNENIFVSACDDGRVLIWDVRQTYSDAYTLASCSSAYHAVMHNPVEPQYIATANAKDGVCLWDVRKPRVSVVKYGSSTVPQSAMSVRFNSTGTHLLALRRRLPPVMYDVTTGHTAAEFDHPEYYNSCTMKSCCFAGDRDQYVLSGSDDFKLYIWRIPDNLSSKRRIWVNKAHFVLRGHRSIVNQVRYNNAYGILASSGVEKIVKIWSTFPISYNDITDGYTSEKDLSRKVYSHEEYINLVLESGQFMTHDYSHHSVQEDPRMMAFFDSLVQRDIEGWTSDSSDATDIFTNYEVQSSESSPSSSSSNDTDDEQPHKGSSKGYKEQSETPKLHPVSFTVSPIPIPDKPVNTTSSEEIKDFSIDRISLLIAQKRQETRRKSARSALSHRKYKTIKKSLKKFKKISNRLNVIDVKDEKIISNDINSQENDSHSNVDDEGKSSTDLTGIIKDKRKFLCKKRAKISKDPIFGDTSSSDSDASNTGDSGSTETIPEYDQKVIENDCNANVENSEEDDVVEVNNGAGQEVNGSSHEVNNGVGREVNYGVSHEVSNGANHEVSNGANHEVSNGASHEVSNGVSHEVNNGASHGVNNGVSHEVNNGASHGVNNGVSQEVNNGASHKECNEIDSVLPIPNNSLNGNTNSNSLVYFTSKNVKHNNRNYRKRSAEEMDDE